MSDSREQFEAWLTSPIAPPTDTEINRSVEYAWRAWQASRAQPERKLSDDDIYCAARKAGLHVATPGTNKWDSALFATVRAILAAQPAAATPEEVYQLREQNNHLVALFDAAKNLIKVKGRHNTEIAYQRLATAFDAASEDRPAAQAQDDGEKR